MDKDITTEAKEPALFTGAAWFDPIEAGLRGGSAASSRN